MTCCCGYRSLLLLVVETCCPISFYYIFTSTRSYCYQTRLLAGTFVCYICFSKSNMKYFWLWQSNYSSHIVFSHIPIEFGPTLTSAVQSADPEDPTLAPNTEWIGWSVAEISPFEIFKIDGSVDRGSVDTNERAPPKPQPVSWYSIYLPLRDGRLSWPRLPGNAPTGSRTCDLSITSPMPYHYTTEQAPMLCILQYID